MVAKTTLVTRTLMVMVGTRHSLRIANLVLQYPASRGTQASGPALSVQRYAQDSPTLCSTSRCHCRDNPGLVLRSTSGTYQPRGQARRPPPGSYDGGLSSLVLVEGK